MCVFTSRTGDFTMVVAAEIHPAKYYDESGVSHVLSLPIDRLREECNRDRLKCVKRSGRRFFRGQWIIDWLDGDVEAAVGDSTDE